MEDVKNSLVKNRLLTVAVLMFLVVTGWWLTVSPLNSDLFVDKKNLWSSSYEFIAIFGGICGLFITKHWGGRKSVLGRAVLAFSIGLFLQAFGQVAYNYYTLFQHMQAPYPSLGDTGYFGSIFAYMYGVISLARYAGVSISFKSLTNKILAVIIPLGLLTLSYFTFLKDYQFDWSNPLKVFLDFGYPLGQAFYVSIALLVLFLSRKFLGGILKKPVLLLTFALIIQYASDSNFLYQANNNNWYTGSIGDFMYAVSYFVMTLAIIHIGNIFQKIRSESQSLPAVKPESGVTTGIDKLHNQILTEIIKRQVRVAGYLAWQEVKKVSGITVTNEQDVVVSINGDPKQVIDQLLANYKNLFGDLAVEVSKNAVYYLVAELPADQVPDSLK